MIAVTRVAVDVVDACAVVTWTRFAFVDIRLTDFSGEAELTDTPIVGRRLRGFQADAVVTTLVGVTLLAVESLTERSFETYDQLLVALHC